MLAVILILFDIFVLWLGFFLAYFVKVFFHIGYQFSLEFYITKHYWLPFLIVILFYFQRLYTSRVSFFEESYRIARIVTFALMPILAFAMIYNVYSISRYMLGSMWLWSIVMVPILKRALKRSIFSMGLFLKDVDILTNSKDYGLLLKMLRNNIYLGYRVRHISDRLKSLPGGDTILIHRYNLNPSEMAYVFQNYRCVKFVYGEVDIPLLNSDVENIFTVPVSFLVSHNNLRSKSRNIAKRAFDLTFSTLVLLFLWPLFLIIALLIKLDSPGPVFYKQRRPGRGGRMITIYKFRTMYVNAEDILKELLKKDEKARREWEQFRKLKRDPRVTRVGRFLRKYSLDELPQFINVLRGEMSVVGPRPYQMDEVDKMGVYREIIFSVNPGITGLWQIAGRSELTFDEKLKIESWYVLNWNLWMDTFIVARTIPAVLSGRGAY